MADWKEMYLKMFRASEKAMRILETEKPDCGEAVRALEAAQLECEEMYLQEGDDEYVPERDMDEQSYDDDEDDGGHRWTERDMDEQSYDDEDDDGGRWPEVP